MELVNRATRSDVFPDGFSVMLRRDGDFLWKVTKAEVFKGDFAVVELLLTENNAEKRGFSGAVYANNADFVASFEPVSRSKLQSS